MQHCGLPVMVTFVCWWSPKYISVIVSSISWPEAAAMFLKFLTPGQQTGIVCRPDGVTGYIRVVVFSQNAAADVQHAVQELISHVCQSTAVA